MFRKIVSQLPFSPTLIVELSEYAKKIRREERLRLVGLMTVGLVLILQIITYIYPPDQSSASNNVNILTPSLDIGELQPSIESVNITQGGIDASSTKAHPGDKITYNLVLTSRQDTPQVATLAVSLADILEYATVSNTQDGVVDGDSAILHWDPIELQPGETVVRSFSIAINTPIAPSPQSNDKSFDCVVTLEFANKKNSVDLQCPLVKSAEIAISKLPKLDSSYATGLFAGLALIAGYLYARSRQLRREVKIVRHDLNTGGSL